jgi:tRNA nucleotidyltransferase (CCA-adding enzyme)
MNSDVEVVLRGIKAAGGYGVIVGGSVRDQVMGRENKDVDIEVYFLSREQLQEALEKVALVTEAGKSFGVFKVRSGMTDIDVSMPRTDSKVGPGHRGFEVKVDSNLDLRSACLRRDFTMNALVLDPDSGTIFDFHGGLEDLRNGVLRHTSDAFDEDPLRVLRAVQFVARFGFTIHPETYVKCFDLRGAFYEISKERVWTEWEKIGTKGIHFVDAVSALDDAGWIGYFPELSLVSGVEAESAAWMADKGGFFGEDRLVIVFAGLLRELSASLAREFLNRIGCPAKIQARIIPLVSHSDAFDEYPTRPAVLKLARALYPASIQELHLIKPSNRWIIQALRFYVSQRPEKPLLTGDILIDCGFTPGPQFKVMLKTALDAQDNCEFITEKAAISWLSANYG